MSAQRRKRHPDSPKVLTGWCLPGAFPSPKDGPPWDDCGGCPGKIGLTDKVRICECPHHDLPAKAQSELAEAYQTRQAELSSPQDWLKEYEETEEA